MRGSEIAGEARRQSERPRDSRKGSEIAGEEARRQSERPGDSRRGSETAEEARRQLKRLGDSRRGPEIAQVIVDEARKWIGTKFRHHGRNAQGVDCVGLLYVVYSKFGALDDFLEYPSKPETGFVFRTIQRYANRIPQSVVMNGDIVLLNFAGSSTHFGILTEYGVIHADTSLKCVVEHALPKGAGRVVAYFRMKGM